jgi:hypothetical protein
MCGRGSGRIEKTDEDARFERSEVDARASRQPNHLSEHSSARSHRMTHSIVHKPHAITCAQMDPYCMTRIASVSGQCKSFVRKARTDSHSAPTRGTIINNIIPGNRRGDCEEHLARETNYRFLETCNMRLPARARVPCCIT